MNSQDKLQFYRFMLYVSLIISITLIDITLLIMLLFYNTDNLLIGLCSTAIVSTLGLYSFIIHKIVYFRKKEIKKS